MPSAFATGEVREWLNRADSKSVVRLVRTEGSNPSLSVTLLFGRARERGRSITGRGDRVAEGERLESVCTLTGYRGFESPPLRYSPLRR